ncbi:hypothetical protein H7I41_03970 [Mycobacterium manitobense]|uniref:Uncharacterized protein n=1 Tax=[Mycobacterium] manitobense TaxID=190147 RepID=A0A9X3BLN3_9MYCO|nr:hypothetical protein [[Mycobacterium] manitobense]MCV7169080.1 hypothetical protein [[Mycobacterium] manitobense]
MTTTCFGIAALDDDGKLVGYLPFDPAWQPGTGAIRLTKDRSKAWRFADKLTADEIADVMSATSGRGGKVDVIEIDCDGPPLTVTPPRTLQ